MNSAKETFALETDDRRAVHGTVRPLVRLRFAYADPPYFGLAAKFYGDLHPDAAAYDRLETHAALILRLCDEWPDGWAMSLHAPSLRHILPLCPDDVRVLAWVKPMTSFKPNVRLAYAWEPIILRGGRPLTREQPTQRDWLACSCIDTSTGRLKGGFKGGKPEGLVRWLLAVMNADPADEITDLFPGSGDVTRAIQAWRAEGRLPLY
ncbi:MAG: hypothetical protein K9N51_02375 [Candidatus Pacebacteria bacterium]|nr:hypothetical protein [Candidatus Paceibacterota bacterium]